MLNELVGYFEKHRVPYVFDFQCSVLWDMGTDEINGTKAWLVRTVKRLTEAQGKENCRDVWRGNFV